MDLYGRFSDTGDTNEFWCVRRRRMVDESMTLIGHVERTKWIIVTTLARVMASSLCKYLFLNGSLNTVDSSRLAPSNCATNDKLSIGNI